MLVNSAGLWSLTWFLACCHHHQVRMKSASTPLFSPHACALYVFTLFVHVILYFQAIVTPARLKVPAAHLFYALTDLINLNECQAETGRVQESSSEYGHSVCVSPFVVMNDWPPNFCFSFTSACFSSVSPWCAHSVDSLQLSHSPVLWLIWQLILTNRTRGLLICRLR